MHHFLLFIEDLARFFSALELNIPSKAARYGENEASLDCGLRSVQQYQLTQLISNQPEGDSTIAECPHSTLASTGSLQIL